SIPLSQQALMILAGVTPNAQGLVFVSSQSKTGEFSDAAMCAVMDRLGIDATTHGWRSTFRDWGSETTEYPNEMLEMALAHTIENKAEAAYRRGDMLERRRPLMQECADYVMPLPTAS
ncbi:MAG: integrase, partial [Armatimonadia bacterium]